MEDLKTTAERIIDNVEKVIVGKQKEVELVLLSLICHGHVLIEDVPGVGKTMLAKSVAKSIGCTFKRIQFTPDLLPSDITGVSIFNQKSSEFEFRPGPIMAQVVLADEINRATPKTQSALLECMEERQVTVDGATHHMPRPFLVMATQNPIEYEGTFPLPEAQLDRFFLRITLGYPSTVDEITILERLQFLHPIEELGQVVDAAALLELQEEAKKVHVDPLIRQYVVTIIEATRNHPDTYLGSSPRGSLALSRSSQAYALLHDRDYVIPDDVKMLAEPVLSHRLIVSAGGRLKGASARNIVKEVLDNTPVPGIRVRR
ncbi:MAG: MoxR family ATPase [Chloroflexi bacterium]|nr:MoxR family ATPase [Chloroflexota bacterium]